MPESRTEKITTPVALIDAAIELFGEQGFDAVSTRTLAVRAGANLAAIQYHFRGKDALYRAAIDHVIAHFAPRVTEARALFECNRAAVRGDPAAVSALLATIAGGLIHAFLGEAATRRIVPFLLREFFVPGPHFERFYDALPRRLHELVTEMVALARNGDTHDEAIILQAHAVIGQLVVFHIGQPILLRRMQWDQYTPPRIQQIIDVCVPSIQRSLGLPEVSTAITQN